MNPSINSIDDGERRAAELIIKPAGDETANHRFAMAFAFERPGRWRAGCAVFCKALVQPLDDIAAFPERTQAWFRILGNDPTRGAGWLSKPQSLERPHPANPDLPQRVALGVALRPKIHHPLRPSRFPGNHLIEFRPAFCGHLRLKTPLNLQLRSRT